MKHLATRLLMLASFSAFAQDCCDVGPNDKVKYEAQAVPIKFKLP